MNSVVSLSQGEMRRLGLRGQMSLTGWQLPEDMKETEWVRAGSVLARIERGIGWWIGDWWAFGEHRYGRRKALIDGDDWRGSNFETCMNAASVCRSFETSRRHEVLSFGHHAEVAALLPAEADRLLDWCEEPLRAGERSPRSTRELRAAVVELRNSDRLRHIIDQPSLFPDQRYSVLYADPPWQYDHPISSTRRIENHYPTMDIEAICMLPVATLARDRAMLFLWVPPSFLHKGLRVIEAWGFAFLTSMVWDKERDGMGYYARQRHEHLLIANYGDPIVPVPSSLSSSIIAAPRSKHSEKPTAFRDAIDRMYPGLSKIELFARLPCEGWAAWGNERVE